MRWVGDLVPPAPSARRFLVIRRGTIGPRGKFRVEIQVGPTSDDIDTRRTVADQLDDLEAAREAAREHRAKNRVTEWRLREARSAIDSIVDEHGTRPVELILEGEPPSFAGITDNEAAAIQRAADVLGEDELRERVGLDEGNGDGEDVDFPGTALGVQETLDEGADPLAGVIEFVERRRREFGPSTTFSEAIEHLVDVARVLEDTPPDPSEPRIDDLQEAMEALLRRFRRWAEANVSKLARDPTPAFEDLIDAVDTTQSVVRATAETFIERHADMVDSP